MTTIQGHWCRALLALACVAGAAHAADGADRLKPVPASVSPAATNAMILGATWAGPRAVAVGDHGTVLLSDDRGSHFRQARTVPVSSLLTSVSFVNERQGWAVGHWGAVLVTSDGGETWSIQRLDTATDRPLFAVHFFDARHGVAVGLWSLVLTTEDGGLTWIERTIEPPPGAKKADLNLLSLFTDNQGALYSTAERGKLLRSNDRGATWRYIETGYAGSLWTGLALADGSLIAAGQRGTVMRAPSFNGPWTQVPMQSRSSITSIALETGGVVLAGLDGLFARSTDGGRSFTVQPMPGSAASTAVLTVPGEVPVVFTTRGIVRSGSRS